MNIKKTGTLLISIALCQMAGVIGSLFTMGSVQTWYPLLNKPSFNPPSWVFGPVWTLLYTLMGISLFLIWENVKNSKKKDEALRFFLGQLILNALWSILFFGMQNPFLAFIEILGLVTLIVLTMQRFYKLNKWAGRLLVPYLLWVLFAAVLNGALWMLN